MLGRGRGTRALVAAMLVALVLAGASHAETRVTLKAAKAGSSYCRMAVQIAETVKAGTEGDISITVEESQGSVQNVTEAVVRSGNYVFTSPPALIGLAREGKAMFEGRGDARFDEIRALSPIPSPTMHFVASEGEKYLGLFGLEGKAEIADVELSNAVAALRKGQIDAFVTAGSWPAPNVVEAAAGTGVRTRPVIPAGTSKRGRTRTS